MRRLINSTLIGAVALGLVIGSASTAQAIIPVPIPNTTQQWAAFSSFAVPDEEDAVEAVSYINCPSTRPLPAASKTEQAAIAAALVALRKIEKPQALAQIDKAIKAYDKVKLQDLAYTLAVNRRLGGVILVSLRLAAKTPTREPLVNAASLFTHFGQYAVANNLLTWAAKRPADPQADASTVAAFFGAQAEVQWRYGRFAAAETLFSSANSAYGIGTGARIGLARALYCQGKEDDAARWWARGQRAIDLASPFDETTDEPQMRGVSRAAPRWKIILVEPLFDANDGIGGAKFASFDPPENANVPLTFGLDAYNFASAALAKSDQYIPDTVSMNWIQQAISRYAIRLTETDRSLSIISDMMDVQWGIITDAADNGPNDDGCGAADNHGAFWGAVRRLYELHQDYADRLHQIWTAAARQVSSPAVNKYFNQVADEAVYREYYDFLADVADIGGRPGWDGISGSAVEAAGRVQMNDLSRQEGIELLYPSCRSSFNGFKTAEFKGPDSPSKAGDGGLCTKPLKGFNVKVGLVPKDLGLPVSADLKTNCDSTSLKVKGKLGGIPGLAMLGIFGSEKMKHGSDDVEIFAGVAGDYGSGVVSAESAIGVYVKMGNGPDGYGIKDVGIRNEATVKVTEGEFGYDVKHSTSLSFFTGDVDWE